MKFILTIAFIIITQITAYAEEWEYTPGTCQNPILSGWEPTYSNIHLLPGRGPTPEEEQVPLDLGYTYKKTSGAILCTGWRYSEWGPPGGGPPWFYYVWPDTGNDGCWQVVGGTGDADADGIQDCFDPTPNNSAPFSYRLFKHQGTEGNMTYMEFIDENGSKWGVGDYSPGTTSYIDMGSSFYSSTETDPSTSENSYSKFITDNGLSCSGSPDTDFSMDQVAELSPATGEPSETGTGTTQGTDNTGNTSETDFLADIVSNTKATTDNLARLADYLASINKNIQKIRNDNLTLSGTPSTIAGGDPTEPGESLTEAEVKNANKEAMAEDRASYDTEVQNNLGHISGQQDPVYDTEYAAEDIPEEENITTIFDNLLSNNPVTNYVTNTQVTLDTPVCSFDWEWKGKTIPFSICQFESNLETFGNILVGLAGLVSILIVFRR